MLPEMRVRPWLRAAPPPPPRGRGGGGGPGGGARTARRSRPSRGPTAPAPSWRSPAPAGPPSARRRARSPAARPGWRSGPGCRPPPGCRHTSNPRCAARTPARHPPARPGKAGSSGPAAPASRPIAPTGRRSSAWRVAGSARCPSHPRPCGRTAGSRFGQSGSPPWRAWRSAVVPSGWCLHRALCICWFGTMPGQAGQGR